MVKPEGSIVWKLTTLTKAQWKLTHFNRNSHSILYHNVFALLTA